MPGGQAKGQGFYFVGAQAVGQAGHELAAVHGAHGFARNGARGHGGAQVEAAFEEQLKYDVGLGAAFHQVFGVVEHGLRHVRVVGVPGADVGVGELEDPKTQVGGRGSGLVAEV